MEWLTTATSGVLDVFSTVLSTITDTPILALLFAGGTIIPIGMNLLNRFKGTV